MSRIFISYRREDTSGHVLALIPRLRERFGAERVFKDTDNIAPGEHFVATIKKELESCSVLLAVIGRDWLNAHDRRLDRRRLDDPEDFIRLEVGTALKNESIVVIPVLVGHAPMPTADQLPPDLAALAQRNAIELSDSRWESDIERLIAAVEQVLGKPRKRRFALTDTSADGRAARRSRMRALTIIGAGALIGIAIVGAAWRTWVTERGRGVAGSLDPSHVAVLYFQDLSPAHDLGYIADGLTESVIDQLQEVSSLDVVSKNGVQQVRKQKLAPDSAARLLNAGTLIEGSVQPIGSRLRVDVKLTDGNSSGEIQRGSFEYPSTDPLGLRDRLVRDVADFLRTRIGEQIRLQQSRTGTQNQEAWLLAQRAERSIKDAEALTASGDTAGAKRRLVVADSLLAISETRDKRWVEPVVLRGTVAFRRSRIASSSTEMAERIDEGMKSAESAIVLDSRNAAALELRGTLRYWRWLNDLIPDPKEANAAIALAEQDLKNAVRIDPDRASAWSVLSTLYTNKSDPIEASIAARRAYEADAYLSAAPEILWRLYNTAYDNEQPVEASHWCTEGQRRFPSNPRFVQCQLWLFTMAGTKPDVAQAWRLVDSLKKVTPEGDWPFESREAEMLVAGALARAGMTDSARHVLERSRGNPSIDPSRDLVIDEAVIRTIIGDKAEAIQLLKSYLVANPDHRTGMATTQSWWWRDLKNDPRYREMVGAGT